MSDEIEKLKMHSPDLTQDNIAKIRALFPGCVTEAADENGKLRLAVDFDQLRQELTDSIVEGPQERYHLNWPGKREALITANAPIAKTLRPARDESVDFDTTQNLFIEGDNLEALKLLQETYLGKVKMIYIDPPYNTGNDFVYDDDFAESSESFLDLSQQTDENKNKLVANPEGSGRFHSNWLDMIYPRLRLARNLLTEDGVAFVSIDDSEVHNLRKVCDEIFGPENFIDNVIWKKRYGGGAKERHLVSIHEYALMYARDINSVPNLYVPLGEDSIQRYYKNQDEHFEKKGPYRTHPLEAMKSFEDRPNLNFGVKAPDGTEVWPKRQWRWSKDRMEQALAGGEVHFQKAKDGGWTLSSKQYLRDETGETRASKFFSIVDGVYTQHGTNEMVDIFGDAQVFSFPKPTEFVRRLIELITGDDKEAIILDFFAGSSATAHASLLQNALDAGARRFVMVQLPEELDTESRTQKVAAKFCEGLNVPLNIAEISKERIRRAGQKILEGECHPDWNKDVGFRVLKIDSSNMADVFYTPDQTSQADLLSRVDNVKPDRTAEDLLFQVLLDWGVDLTLPIRRETVQGKTVFFVADTALMACFDDGISEDLVKELAGHAPMRIVFKDTGFANDQTKINVRQIFKAMSPETEVKAI
ncbi:putative methyltransferase [Thalassovita autumnalis]|uniref:site-specific DNA-methyltransferase (adenine-specific) n=1 Tax=Thalassovita autumnalis TaxID=2072972 RepID=A0ABP2AFT7_9RHOB|nr:site-specific DNA-methyltransferase [Thalassovita autumnalis]CUH64801.1 putative methyltransferase [Thalassovita autumnalis]